MNNDLSNYACAWSRNGPVALSGPIIGYRQIPGPKPGQQIWMNNVGTPERPDWQYRVYQNNEELCCNRHFRSAEAARSAADEWLDVAASVGLTLRAFKHDC